MKSSFGKKEEAVLVGIAETIGSTLGAVAGKARAVAKPARRRARTVKKQVKRAGIRAKKDIRKVKTAARKAVRKVSSTRRRIRGKR